MYFCQGDLKEVDFKIRGLLTERGVRHRQYLNTLLYSPHTMGGQGLKEVTTTYKETRIKVALRITASKDPKLRAVATFQQVKESKGRKSMLKDAKEYANELKLDLDLDGDPQITFKSTEGHTYTATSLEGTKRVFHKARTNFTKSEIKESTWQGNIVCQRLGDETIDLSDFSARSRNWISAPTYTICGVNEIYQQLSRTRVREEMMGLTSDRLCRKCHQYPETVEYILSGCPELAQRQ